MHTQINPVDTRPHSRTTFTPSFWFAKKKNKKSNVKFKAIGNIPKSHSHSLEHQKFISQSGKQKKNEINYKK